MRVLTSAAGRSFLRAFAATFLILVSGILAAPNMHERGALAAAAGLASVAAGIRAVQVYVPQLSVAHYFDTLIGALIDSFLRAALATLCVTLPGALTAPNLHTVPALAVAALVGAGAAGFQAIERLLTKGQTPKPGVGVPEPPTPPDPQP